MNHLPWLRVSRIPWRSMRAVNSQFKGGVIELDGNEFIGCTFQGVKLVYKASGPVTLTNCIFDNVQFAFEGGAGDTVGFLRGMYHGMGQSGRIIVEQLFESIRSTATVK